MGKNEYGNTLRLKRDDDAGATENTQISINGIYELLYNNIDNNERHTYWLMNGSGLIND